jgi:ABC-2 type transport system ATP-binding protein
VGEYLSFAARLRGVPPSDVKKRVDEAVELTEVGEERERLIGALSHGFRQRVGIAQAIIHRPKLVVLDEPISGLDPKQIVEMRQLVRSLRGEHTVLVSSHILSEISETCDRILVIRDGTIAAAGTEQELFAHLSDGMRVDLTVRAPSGADGAQGLSEVLSAVEGVSLVETRDPLERGERILSARVVGNRDVRDAVCRALVAADFGVLQLSRSEHELESVFLQLSGVAPGASRSKRLSSSEADVKVLPSDSEQQKKAEEVA